MLCLFAASSTKVLFTRAAILYSSYFYILHILYIYIFILYFFNIFDTGKPAGLHQLPRRVVVGSQGRKSASARPQLRKPSLCNSACQNQHQK